MLLGQNIYNSVFPKDQPDDAVPETRQCLNFGEAVSVFPGDKKDLSLTTGFFKGFYHGLKDNAIIWFAYKDPENRFESIFRFEDVTSDDHNRILFEHIIRPCILPSNFSVANLHHTNSTTRRRQLANYALANCQSAFISKI